MNTFNRRQFIHAGIQAAGGLCLAQTGCMSTHPSAVAGKRIAFNTANLVARITNYRFELKNWGEQHQKTVALTDEIAWAAICREIAGAGFSAVEIWEAHAAPETLTRDKAARWKRILDDHGLRPIAYAGGLRRETLEICRWLSIPHVDGGLRGQTPEQATALCQEFGVRFNVENHPEKTAAEALAKVGGGNEWLGLCVDTGWFGSQSADVPTQIRAAGPFVRHTHIKDVKTAGGHETCLLGEGIVNVPACLSALHDIGYSGFYSWEDEPEDRNPFDSAIRNRKWIETHLDRLPK
jgi:sugar phosphate isomerase/epimerase